MFKIPPICFFPTQTIIIDDSPQFLDALKVSLAPESAWYQFFQQPEEALDYLNHHYARDTSTDTMMQQIDETAYEHYLIEMNIAGVYKQIYNPKRFQQVSCIVVDYDMPSMTGLEFCQQLKHPDIQKILLTGMTEHDPAIRAFNEGAINYFVNKTHRGPERLRDAIQSAHQKYFRRLSEPAHHTILRSNASATALNNPAYETLLQRVIARYNIAEYYLLEQTGSLLMLDSQGALYTLFLMTDTTGALNAPEAQQEALRGALAKEMQILEHDANDEQIEAHCAQLKESAHHGTFFHAFVGPHSPLSDPDQILSAAAFAHN